MNDKKELLGQLNRENVALSYQIEEAMADLTDLEMMIKEAEAKKSITGNEKVLAKSIDLRFRSLKKLEESMPKDTNLKMVESLPDIKTLQVDNPYVSPSKDAKMM